MTYLDQRPKTRLVKAELSIFQVSKQGLDIIFKEDFSIHLTGAQVELGHHFQEAARAAIT